MDEKLLIVMNEFPTEGKILSIEPYGEGHINATYLVVTDKKRYILQKINNYVFPDVEGLMNNICGVTEYLQSKGIETLTVIRTKNGDKYLSGKEPFRLYAFIENTITLQSVKDANVYKNIGYAFGTFQNQLAGYNAKTLVEVIPNFHNTPKRFENFKNSLKADVKGRAKDCEEEIKFILDRKDTLSKITDGIKGGSLPLRVTHNDTKINNILIDDKSGEARAVIDLDTIMPGWLLYDYGDSLRTGAAKAKEDEKDGNKIGIDLGLYKAYTEGFYSAVKNSLTKKEKELMPYSAYLMTIETAIRFITDYLDGDVYFHTAYEGHNLVRARNQIQMAKSIEENSDKMKEIIDSLD